MIDVVRGGRYLFWTATHAFAGKVVEADHAFALLEDADQVFNAGDLAKLDKEKWKEAEHLPGRVRVNLNACVAIYDLAFPKK